MTDLEIKQFRRETFDVSDVGWHSLRVNHYNTEEMEMFTALDEDNLVMDIARFRTARDEWLFYNSYHSTWRAAVLTSKKKVNEEYNKLIRLENRPIEKS